MQPQSAAAAGSSKAPGREETPGTPWREVLTSAQGSYFYHEQTRETTWDRPAHYKRATGITIVWEEPAPPPARPVVTDQAPQGNVPRS